MNHVDYLASTSSRNLVGLSRRSFSSWRTLLPVSMAVELATARTIAFLLGFLAVVGLLTMRASGVCYNSAMIADRDAGIP